MPAERLLHPSLSALQHYLTGRQEPSEAAVSKSPPHLYPGMLSGHETRPEISLPPERLFAGEFTPALLLRCYIRRLDQPDDIPIHFDIDPLPPWLSYACVFPWYRITLPMASVPKIPLFISSCLLEMIKVISMRASTMGDPRHFRAGGPPAP